MAYGYEGFLAALASYQPSVPLGVERPLCVRSSPCSLDERGFDVLVALRGLGALLLSCALVVAGTHACPLAQVARRGELRHVQANLGDDFLAGAGVYSWHLTQAVHRLAERSGNLLDALVQFINLHRQLAVAFADAL